MNHHFNVENSHRRHQNRGLGIFPGSAHREPAYWVGGVRHKDGVSSILALVRNCKNLHCDAKEDGQEKKIEALSTNAQCGGGLGAKGPGWFVELGVNPEGEERMTTTKPFDISKRLVWEAYKRVKANAGAAGVDGQSLEDFERSLANNRYRIWNRMASGSYFPSPVKAVSIPKKAGGKHILGIPTVADRIAQTVVKQVLEPSWSRISMRIPMGTGPANRLIRPWL